MYLYYLFYHGTYIIYKYKCLQPNSLKTPNPNLFHLIKYPMFLISKRRVSFSLSFSLSRPERNLKKVSLRIEDFEKNMKKTWKMKMKIESLKKIPWKRYRNKKARANNRRERERRVGRSWKRKGNSFINKYYSICIFLFEPKVPIYLSTMAEPVNYESDDEEKTYTATK